MCARVWDCSLARKLEQTIFQCCRNEKSFSIPWYCTDIVYFRQIGGAEAVDAAEFGAGGPSEIGDKGEREHGIDPKESAVGGLRSHPVDEGVYIQLKYPD